MRCKYYTLVLKAAMKTMHAADEGSKGHITMLNPT
jgi:hypothetical protein